MLQCNDVRSRLEVEQNPDALQSLGACNNQVVGDVLRLGEDKIARRQHTTQATQSLRVT